MLAHSVLICPLMSTFATHEWLTIVKSHVGQENEERVGTVANLGA